MPLGLFIIGLLLAFFVVSFLVSAALLWFSARVCRVDDASYKRSMLAVLLTTVIGLPLGLLGLWVDSIIIGWGVVALLALNLAMIAVSLGVNVACVKWVFRATTGRAVLTTGLWLLFGVGYAVGAVYGLKVTATEAFVIPTGAMADSLWGYHKTVTCPICGHVFAINASSEADPMNERLRPITRCECPNCRSDIEFTKSMQGRIHEVQPADFAVSDDPPMRDEVGRTVQYNFSIAPTAKITLDGKDVSLEALPKRTRVRVTYRRGNREASWIEAVRGGDFTAPSDLDPPVETGDRIIVAKFGYGALQRQQIVVFRFPVDPRINYVKRLIGLPGETIAIHGGKLYVYPESRQLPAPPSYWSQSTLDQFRWPDDAEAQDWFRQGKFQIVRKSADLVLALRHLVHDNDCQPADTKTYPARWTAESGWQGNGPLPKTYRLADSGQALSWLRYRHRLRGDAKPSLITDMVGYNSSEAFMAGENWVGDLMLECTVVIDKAEGELRLELSKGVDRFQARIDLASGLCRLIRLTSKGETELASASTGVKQPGSFQLRFANVDQRLHLWVDEKAALQDQSAGDYPAPGESGPTENDLEPARIGAQNAAVTVSHIKLWRDLYYTTPFAGEARLGPDALSDPAEWEPLRRLPVNTFYIHPGHYFCLGDNSAASADSRYWGLVPERLMLGPAVVKYLPWSRAGWVR